MAERKLPTEFTPEQLERMRMLALKERSVEPGDHDLHNLWRKLDEYCVTARNVRAA